MQQAAQATQKAQQQALDIGKEQRQAQRDIPADIEATTSLAGLITEPGITQRAKYAGMDITPQMPAPFSLPNLEGQPGDLPSENFPVTHAPAIEDLIAQRTAKEAALAPIEAKAEPVERMPFWDEKMGREMSQFVPRSQAPAFGALPQGPTPQQAGEIKRTEMLAGELHPMISIAKANQENEMRNLTLPGEVEAIRQGARARGQVETEFMGPRLQEAEQKAQIEAQYREPTEYERRTGLQLNTLLNADASALESEGKGATIPMAAMTVAGSPGMADVNAWLREISSGRVGVPPETLAYVYDAVNYSGIYTQIRSGVQTREEEFPRYLTNLFAVEGDTPAAVKAKQQRRAVFHAATEMSLSGNDEGAGRMLARAIKAGRLPADVIPALRLSPGVDAAFAAEMAQTQPIPR